VTTLKENILEAENSALRELVAQAGLDASRLLEQAGIKATERDAAERLQRLLLEELHHRVKNTLATVMAIASQSLRNATDLEQGRKSISHRLIALGRAHDLLLQSNWVSARLPAIVHASIEPFETTHNKRFVVLGADIDVAPAGVLALAMALNELCTNAVKYGALSNPGGRVEIKSILDEKAQRFKLVWEEKGGPVVKEPKRRSFGTRLIESSLARSGMRDCGLSLRASSASLIFRWLRCKPPSKTEEFEASQYSCCDSAQNAHNSKHGRGVEIIGLFCCAILFRTGGRVPIPLGPYARRPRPAAWIWP
jgi:two-component sensor histidine kinase